MLETELLETIMRHAAVASPFAVFIAASLLAGCPDRSLSEVDPQQGRVELTDLPINPNHDLDVLFLIDDSPSMGDKQANLAANFPRFIDVLSSIPTIPGGLPNIRIGVVTSDLGTKGALDAPPGFGPNAGACTGTGKSGILQIDNGAPVTGPFLSDIQPDPLGMGMRVKNYTGQLNAVFAQMARVGAAGCGFEQHLEAIKQALQPSNTANGGFLRDNAFLAIVIIADEDDCSMSHFSLLGNSAADKARLGTLESFRCTRFGIQCDGGGTTSDAMNQVGIKTGCHPNDASPYLTNVAEYATFLKGLKKNPLKVIVAGIIGNPDHVETVMAHPKGNPEGALEPQLKESCKYTGADGLETADPAVRIKFFLDQFPNRNTFASICQQDLSGALQQIAELLATVIGNPCIEGKLADTDPKTPGLQPECSVAAVTDQGLDTQKETILPKCIPESPAAGNAPCWYLPADPLQCPNSDHLQLKFIDGVGPKALATDTHVVAGCVTEAN